MRLIWISYFCVLGITSAALETTTPADQVSREAEGRSRNLDNGEGTTSSTAIAAQIAKVNLSIDTLNKSLAKLKESAELLEKKRSELMTAVVLKINERSNLDFSRDHSQMLDRLNDSVDLTARYKDLLDQFKLLETRVAGITLDPAVEKSEVKPKYDKLKSDTSDSVSGCEEKYKDLQDYRSAVSATLIESVHSYQVRNHFRIWIGFAWFACFLIVAGATFTLFRSGRLGVQDSNSLQLVAMVMIIFVVMLFGITDVMGENGVTGILAAIAGYILGKTSASSGPAGSGPAGSGHAGGGPAGSGHAAGGKVGGGKVGG